MFWMFLSGWWELLKRLQTPLGWLEFLAARERMAPICQLPYFLADDGRVHVLASTVDPRARFRLHRFPCRTGEGNGARYRLVLVEERYRGHLSRATILYEVGPRELQRLHELGYREFLAPRQISSSEGRYDFVPLEPCAPTRDEPRFTRDRAAQSEQPLRQLTGMS